MFNINYAYCLLDFKYVLTHPSEIFNMRFKLDYFGTSSFFLGADRLLHTKID